MRALRSASDSHGRGASRAGSAEEWVAETLEEATEFGPFGRDRRVLDMWTGDVGEAKPTSTLRPRVGFTPLAPRNFSQPSKGTAWQNQQTRPQRTANDLTGSSRRNYPSSERPSRWKAACQAASPSSTTISFAIVRRPIRLSLLSTKCPPLSAALAAQFRAVYRFGQPAGCPAKFEDFKFCMSLKGVSEERRQEVWIRRRAESWAERRMGKSSEDVWTART